MLAIFAFGSVNITAMRFQYYFIFMKKVSSSATYSQFRKKNQNLKEAAPKETNISQIDELAKQLEALNSRKKINSHKYDHPNGIIEEEQEDETFALNIGTKNKAQNLPSKKLKVLTSKVQSTSTKMESTKLNKSIQSMILQKKEKQTVSSKQINFKNSVKLPKKEQKQQKMTRRMSLTTLGKGSFISTNQSINTSLSQSQNQGPLMRKKQIMDKLSQIQAKLTKKSIPVQFFQQIMQKIQKIDQILEEC